MTPNDLKARLLAALQAPGRPSSDYDLNPGAAPGTEATVSLRPAAVLVPILEHEGRLQLILTKRSSALRHHPGQVAFPGGKVDLGDPDEETTALREAEEEIGLPRQRVEVLGRLPGHATVTTFKMTPVIGWIHGRFDPVPEVGEVAEVFTLPLTHILEPDNYMVTHRHWRGQERRYFNVPYGPYYIWGATARILRGLADRMAG